MSGLFGGAPRPNLFGSFNSQSSPSTPKVSETTAKMATHKTARGDKSNAISFKKATLLMVVVGKEPTQEHFSVHEGIMCARSEFFRRAMNGNWAERAERLIRLPEDDPEIFAIYVNLVYTNVVATRPAVEVKTTDIFTSEFIELSKLYVLAEKLCDIAAKNAAIESFMATAKERDSGNTQYNPSMSAAKIMYAGTPKGSLGRQLIVDYWTSSQLHNLAAAADEMPIDLWVDLALALRRDRPEGRTSLARRSNVDHYLEKVV